MISHSSMVNDLCRVNFCRVQKDTVSMDADDSVRELCRRVFRISTSWVVECFLDILQLLPDQKFQSASGCCWFLGFSPTPLQVFSHSFRLLGYGYCCLLVNFSCQVFFCSKHGLLHLSPLPQSSCEGFTKVLLPNSTFPFI